jgi:hypothetical protein
MFLTRRANVARGAGMSPGVAGGSGLAWLLAGLAPDVADKLPPLPHDKPRSRSHKVPHSPLVLLAGERLHATCQGSLTRTAYARTHTMRASPQVSNHVVLQRFMRHTLAIPLSDDCSAGTCVTYHLQRRRRHLAGGDDVDCSRKADGRAWGAHTWGG